MLLTALPEGSETPREYEVPAGHLTAVAAKETTRLNTGDLLVITPSRRRPEGVRRLLGAVHDTGKLATHVHVAVDDDDPDLDAYLRVMDEAGGPGDVLETGKRKGLAAWTNEIAVRRAREYPYLAGLSATTWFPGPQVLGPLPDPRHRRFRRGRVLATRGTASGRTSPRPCVMSSPERGHDPRLDACEPSLQHFFIDNVWADLGWGAGCLRHCRGVVAAGITSTPGAGKAVRDTTYEEASPKLDADRTAYQEWRRARMADDIRAIIALREKSRVR